MLEKYFLVRARDVGDEPKARILEALVNRPEIVARIMDEVEKELKKRMDEILWGPRA